MGIFIFNGVFLGAAEIFEIFKIVVLQAIAIEVIFGDGFLKLVDNKVLKWMETALREPKHVFLAEVRLFNSIIK